MREFNAVQVLDRFSLFTPLGIRLWDRVTNSVIADEGLRVTTYPKANANLKTYGGANSQGVYVFRKLPGLRSSENGVAAGGGANPPAQLPYVVEVLDYAQRFLPLQIALTLPLRGLFALPCVSVGTPPAPTTLVPLFSAPARAITGGLAVLRAELWDKAANKPAAWVVMDVRVAGKPPFQGMSDDKGRIALLFPYPEPTDFAADSTFDVATPANPPQLQGSPLVDHQWAVEIHAYYQPSRPNIPDLCSILAQAEASPLADINPASTKTLTQSTLKYGQELVLRSSDTSLPQEKQPSVLWITPAA
jgi:hypothetical protein